MRTLTFTLLATLGTLTSPASGWAQFSSAPPGGKFSGGNGAGTQLPHYVGGYLGSSPSASTMNPGGAWPSGFNSPSNFQNPLQPGANLPRNAWQLQEYFNPNSQNANPFGQNAFNQNPFNPNPFGPFPGSPFNQNPLLQNPLNANPFNPNGFNPQLPNTFGWNNFNNPAFGNAFQPNAFQPNLKPFNQPNAGAFNFGMANQFPQVFMPPFR